MGRVVTGDPVLRPARPEDAAACAAIFNDWVDATDWMPRVHPPDDVERHYREHVLATCAVTVAEAAARSAGFLALDGEGFVAGLYLAPEARGRGIGRGAARGGQGARGRQGLTLWTFVANEGARRFYAREGFVEVRRTEGDNEEGLPDVLLAWRAGVRRGGAAAAGADAWSRGSSLLWYVLAVVLNAAWAHDQAGRDGVTLGPAALVAATHGARSGRGCRRRTRWRPSSGRPRSRCAPTSKRSLVYHGWVTLSATLAGFGLGAGLGILLAIGIVHDRTMDASVMPWVIASQTIPILAIAPMIIVVLNSVGVTGLLPKAIISMYLCFFPVAVGMVAGLQEPGPDAARPDAHLERQPGADLPQAALAGGAALALRLAEGRRGGEPGRRDHRRAADRGGGGARARGCCRAATTARPSRSGRR